MGSRVLLYNPLEMSKQEVFSVFTARQDQADFILKSIKDQTEYKTPQHYLIIGPRGIGKTILLRYLHCKIQDDAYLNSHWHVVQFSEEEYGIRTLVDFYKKIVERILADYEESELIDNFEQINEDEELAYESEPYQFLISRFCSQYNKRILVFADNFDYIIRKNVTEQERAGLRKYLLLENHIVLVATTVSLFNELEAYEEPFFDFFAPIRMNRLTMLEGIELIRKRAELEAPGKPTVQKLIKTWKIQVPKFEAIIELTDGNPRLLLILYEILKGNPLQKVLDVFNGLLDELTPYIKAQLDQLSGMQQKIVDTLARSDSGCTPTILAKKAGIDVRKVATQLIRLEEDMAFIKKVKQKKKTYYIIGNKLLRTWYQMRVVRRKIKIYEMLVAILEYWFSDEEIIKQYGTCKDHEERRHLIAAIKDKGLKTEHAVLLAREHIQMGLLSDAKAELEYFIPGEKGKFHYGTLLAIEGKVDEAEKVLKKLAAKGVAEAINNLAFLYTEQGKTELAEKYYLMAVEKGHATAMNNLALIYNKQGKTELAEKYYLMAVEKGSATAMNNLALIYNKQSKTELAEKYYLMAVEKGSAGAMYNLAVFYDAQGNTDLAEKYYLMAVEKEFVNAMCNLAILYDEQSNTELAEKYYLMAVEKRHTAAVYNLAVFYDEQGNTDLAEKYYLMAVKEGDINAMNNLAYFYWMQGKIEKAESLYANLLANNKTEPLHKLHYLHFLFATAPIEKIKNYLFSIEEYLLYEKEPHYLLIVLANIIKEKKCLTKFRKIMQDINLKKYKHLAFLGPVVLATAEYHTGRTTDPLFELSSEQQLLAKVLLSTLGYTPDEQLGAEDPALFFSKLSS